MQERRAARDAALRRVKIKLSFLVRMGAKFDYIASPPGEIASDQFRKNVLDDEESRCFEMTKKRGAEMCTKTKVVVAQTAKKCLGSNNRPPPPFSNSQSLFTFVGSFVSLAVLAGISFALVDSFGGDYLLVVMPPFGGTRAGACWYNLHYYFSTVRTNLLFLYYSINCSPVWIDPSSSSSTS
jgi:hypothetical protein